MKTIFPVSLRKRLLWMTGGTALVMATALAATLALSHDLGSELDRATDDFAEEQRIADRLGEAVMRQLVAASVYPNAREQAIRDTYEAAGLEAYEHIRSYLVRDLSDEQRFQLEQMREEHQRMEVAAARAFATAAAARPGELEAALDDLMARALSLQEASRAFLAMREEDLQRLRYRQASTLRTLYWTGIGLAVLPLLAAVLLGGFLQRTVVAPLDQLTDATRRIAEGDLDTRVPVSPYVELGAAAQGFNHMADRLSDAKQNLDERHRQLERAVTELEATRDELVQSEKLGAMGRMMAGLAHELNNPLTSVVGFSELLAERYEWDGGTDEASELVAPLVGEARRAGELVRNLLHFSRRSASTVEPVVLPTALAVVVGLRSYAFQQAGLAIRVDVGSDLVVLADPQHLQQVLLNIVNNAYDAMRSAGRGVLTIRGRREVGVAGGEEIALSFIDQGPGLEDPDKVFDPFYTTKPVGEGTGLGLALVHRFMEGFGGRIEAGAAPGGGAVFVLRFRPAATDASGTGGTASPPTDRAPDRTGTTFAPRVLVVDDEPAIRALQEKMLSRLGAHVVVAGGGRQARRLLEDGLDVDLVVSDVKMPDGHGADLYRWIAETRPGLARRFIFVTGDVRESSTAAGPPVIRKPFDVADFLDLVRRTLEEATTPSVRGDR